MAPGAAPGPMAGPPHYEYFVIDEVLNYGGFFGGTTVTIYAHPPAQPNADRKFIISEHNFENLKDGDRFKVLEGQVLGLVLEGDEVRTARVAGAPTRAALRAAIAPPRPLPGHEGEVRALAYQCAQCHLWLAGTPPRREPDGPYVCAICGHPLQGTTAPEEK
ncbi:MAG TPA: hypothetical protein VKY74_23620 [Chloroflexia bacterium]|nr:hypothetical protein [Chloroflexia bacterium]